MKITFEIPDSDADRIVDGICLYFGYENHKTKDETKAVFAKRYLVSHLKELVKSGEGLEEQHAVEEIIEQKRQEINEINIQ